MCGLAGFLDPIDGGSADTLRMRVQVMADTLAARGPDDSGAWADEGWGLALGHRRLSIRDLSPGGAQPMVSASGQHVIVYNGEIYDTADLRAELEAAGVAFRGHSDTEVLLEACDRFGVEATLPRVNGMFAFALANTETRELWLVRDRLGIKPLYVGQQGGRICFASQPRAILAHPDWQARIDQQGLFAYFQVSYPSVLRSVFADMRQLMPGSLMRIDADGAITTKRWWTAKPTPPPASFEAATEQLAALAEAAVSARLVSDVPLGAFLSGGIDSSTVAALMHRAAGDRVKTFSIGFESAGYNEAPHARAIAGHLGTAHTELTVTEREAQDIVPLLPDIHDEPFSDSSQIPTALLCRMVRDHVTVALSGDGGDEVFGGYNRHRVLGRDWWKWRLAGRVARCVPRSLMRTPILVEQFGKLQKIANAPHRGVAYEWLMNIWRDVPVGHYPETEPPCRWPEPEGDPLRAVQMYEIDGYLHEDILTKVDRASMSVGLEVRVPLLDHRLVEFGLGLPPDWKVAGGRGKVILRKVLARHVPDTLFARPKAGFAAPIAEWLRGPLREWAEELLQPAAVYYTGLLEAPTILSEWDAFKRGRPDASPHTIWCYLMFEAWRRRWALAA